MAYHNLVSAITEIKKLRSSLNRSRQAQIRNHTEKDHIKAITFSWYKNHKPALKTLIPADKLNEIDSFFKAISELSEKYPSRKKINNLLKNLSSKLIENKSYVLEVSPTKSFQELPHFSTLIFDERMQDILKNRWIEVEKCLSINASLSAVVMMGGMLEGLLMAKVNAYPNKDRLFKCKAVPSDKYTGKKKSLNEWALKTYIDVAHEMGWIGKATRDVGEVLRDYRNLIHPQKELTHGVHISPSDAKIFWSVVTAITNELL